MPVDFGFRAVLGLGRGGGAAVGGVLSPDVLGQLAADGVEAGGVGQQRASGVRQLLVDVLGVGDVDERGDRQILDPGARPVLELVVAVTGVEAAAVMSASARTASNARSRTSTS
ncbi:hypothetical protein GS584_25095 [Rhodococcus hoagii]|nr:hypothetical protein [Prescottella equi]